MKDSSDRLLTKLTLTTAFVVPMLVTACIVGPGTYQVAPTEANSVAYCVAAGDTLNNVAEMARQHCAAQNAQAQMSFINSSANCSRGVYNVGGGQGQMVQYRCVSQ
jgi:hypothetical protein